MVKKKATARNNINNKNSPFSDFFFERDNFCVRFFKNEKNKKKKKVSRRREMTLKMQEIVKNK